MSKHITAKESDQERKTVTSVTFEKVDMSCSHCGEEVPVRVIDNDGYIPNELICEDCFRHDVMGWDDLPPAIFPKEE